MSKKAISFLKDIFFPRLCVGCKKEGSYICKECLCEIPAFLQKSNSLDIEIISLAHFGNKNLRLALYLFKYKFIKELAIELAWLFKSTLEQSFKEEFFPKKRKLLLLPVPLSKKRLEWRGYNQAELLAAEFSKILDMPFENEVLVRVKNQKPQVEIKKAKARRENIIGAFSIDKRLKNKILAKNVILVDDVCTTGATLMECAKVLKAHGAKSVKALVLARA